ncbi:hypothetical protein K0M31_012016 [Melipona bicolor]|uniref:Uncharacterized protein n=1 Tax=Melipona bicolor TaxID=60889 RepID=A0AA40GAM7_9HYME|nr:hypothetical protein K0M31_012016 [Melipona bicolor]
MLPAAEVVDFSSVKRLRASVSADDVSDSTLPSNCREEATKPDPRRIVKIAGICRIDEFIDGDGADESMKGPVKDGMRSCRKKDFVTDQPIELSRKLAQCTEE